MNNNSDHLNSDNLIVFFYKWRKPLIILTVIGAIVSIVVSLLIENKYKSTVVLFPTTTSSISKALLSENNTGREDVLRLGEEEEAEQMLQILNSDEIRNVIIDKYDLAKHYDIDDDVEFKMTKLQKEFDSNVKFERTKFMSVKISVLDHDPQMASNIANDISSLLDTVNNRMRREIAVQALEIVKNEYKNQIDYIKNLEDSLLAIQSLGIIDVQTQTERLTEQMAIAILEGKKSAAEALQIKLDTLSKYSGTFANIQNEITLEQKRVVLVRSKLREAEVDAEKSLQHKFVVNRAFPAEKKSYPIRWLIVVLSTFSTFLMTLVAILLIESVKSARLKIG